MRRRLRLGLCLPLILMTPVSVGAAAVQSPNPAWKFDIQITADVNKFLDQIDGFFGQYHRSQSAAASAAVISSLSDAISEERTLAKQLRLYSKNPSFADYRSNRPAAQTAVDWLNARSQNIKKAFGQLNTDLVRLDPQFVSKYPLVKVDVETFSHDGILFIGPPGRNSLTTPALTAGLADSLDAEANRMQAVILKIAAASNSRS